MRVIAGELGGRRLHAPAGDAVRPTSDRVREALFSILGDVGGLAVLDLYCGTGALGIEALSRGAERATFVDRAIDPAARNVEELGLEERSELVSADVIRFLRRERETYDLVLVDPPYRDGAAHAGDLGGLLGPRIGQDGRVIVETAADTPMDLPALELLDERRYGATMIRIHGPAR